MRKQIQTNWIRCPRGVLGTDFLAGQPFGKLVAIAMVLGLVTSGVVMVLAPEGAGGDDGEYDMSHVLMMLKLDEGTGSITYDETPHGNDGNINGATWAKGINGNALEFDGIDDYIEVPDSNSLEIGEGSFSIEFWLKHDDLPVGDASDEDYIMSKWDNSDHSGYKIRIMAQDGLNGQIGFTIGYGGYDNRKGLYSKISVDDGEWHHICCQKVNDSELRIYVDGKLENSLEYSGVSGIISNDIALDIGSTNGGTERYWEGALDEIVIHSEAIEPSEFYGLRFLPVVNLEPDKWSYLQNDTVTIIATHTAGPANISFLVTDPDDENHLMETVRTTPDGDNHSATLTFRLPSDAPLGTWTLYATSDRDGSKANITFEVIQPPIHRLTLTLGEFDDVKQGDALTVDFIVTNGFNVSKTFLLALQLKDPSLHALRPDIKEGLTINATDQRTWQLSVTIPTDAEVGTYFLQGQMFTDWPDDRGGYVLDYNTTTVTVTAA